MKNSRSLPAPETTPAPSGKPKNYLTTAQNRPAAPPTNRPATKLTRISDLTPTKQTKPLFKNWLCLALFLPEIGFELGLNWPKIGSNWDQNHRFSPALTPPSPGRYADPRPRYHRY